MPRTRNVYNIEFPYHINVRNNNGLPYPCELQDAWNIYCDNLWFCSRIFETRILAFVMMNNHFHLLMVCPKGNLSEFMKYFLKRTSDDIRAIRGVQNHLYGNRYYPSLVSDQKYFQKAFKYIYQNPLRARLCRSILDYPYSSLHGFLGLTKMQIPVYDDFYFFEDLNGNLQWLDEMLDPDQTEHIRSALKRQVFQPGRNQNGFRDDTLLL